MATKFGTKWAITWLALEIFAPMGDFWGWAIECCQLHFSPTDLRCYGNEIWDKIGYNLACVKDICEIFCVYRGVYEDAPSNAANRIFPQSIPVAMATKFLTKLAIAWLV